jgi:hypothetical protein
MSTHADIDIDLADRSQLLALIGHIPARQITNGAVRKHASGVYVSEIPVDPVNQCAAIDYQSADERGYFKIDLLNMHVYQLVKDPAHYQRMLDKSPNWKRLWEDVEWAKKIVHIGNYTDLLASMKPNSVPRMAAFISVIRPGKAHLQNKPWDQVFAEVWDKDASKGYIFKKAHSIGYAALVSLHMNLLEDSEESTLFSAPA